VDRCLSGATHSLLHPGELSLPEGLSIITIHGEEDEGGGKACPSSCPSAAESTTLLAMPGFQGRWHTREGGYWASRERGADGNLESPVVGEIVLESGRDEEVAEELPQVGVVRLGSV